MSGPCADGAGPVVPPHFTTRLEGARRLLAVNGASGSLTGIQVCTPEGRSPVVVRATLSPRMARCSGPFGYSSPSSCCAYHSKGSAKINILMPPQCTIE